MSLNATTVRNESGNLTSAQFDWRDITRRAVEVGDLRSENRQLKERLSSNRLEHPKAFFRYCHPRPGDVLNFSTS